jgi:hypothetical protein
MPQESWYFFLALEADLDATARYVEPAEANDSTYSVEFARILMSASAEVEVVASALVRQVDSLPQRPTIDDLRAAFQKNYPKLPGMEVLVPRASRRLVPWAAWSGQANPDWWSAYHRVKHDRHVAFARATLKNAVNAVAALLCLQLYVHRDVYQRGSLEPWCKLLTLENHYEMIVGGSGGLLPDFP